MLSTFAFNFNLRPYSQALSAYCGVHHPAWEQGSTATMWATLAEFEAVLNCSALTTTLVQTEKYCWGGIGHLIRSACLTALRADTFSIVDIVNVKQNPNVPRGRVSDIARHVIPCQILLAAS